MLRTMDIWNTKKGDLVRFTRPKAGYEAEARLAQKMLKQNEVYTVENVTVGEWGSFVELSDMPVLWNSIHFDNVQRAL